MTRVLSTISIQAKIFSITVILLALLVICSGSALLSMGRIGGQLDAVASQDVPITNSLAAISEYQSKQTIHFERALRRAYLMGRSPDAIENFYKEIKAFDEQSAFANEEISKGKQIASAVISAGHNKVEVAKFERVQSMLASIEERHSVFEENAHIFFDNIMGAGEKEAIAAAEQAGLVANQLTKELHDLSAEIELFIGEAVQQAKHYEKSGTMQLLVGTLLAGVIGGFLSWFISRAIVQRLNKARDNLEIISSGDLTQNIEVDGSDEISSMQRSMQTMHDHLREMIAHISTTASRLSSATEQLSTVTEQSRENALLQLGETEQVATAMNEMNVTVGEVAKNANETSNGASKANDETMHGCSVVEDAVQGIQALAGQINNTAEIIEELDRGSMDISTVLDVIKSIAEQTNLLALNAAIEAARAGEQGRGFAVVADEVRTLAGRTQASTAEINQIIEKLQSGSRAAMQAMGQSQDQAKVVVDQATLAGSSLNTISESATHINSMSFQMASAAEQQSSVAEKVNGNIMRISDFATQSAAGAEKSASASQELARMAVDLQGVVTKFRV